MLSPIFLMVDYVVARYRGRGVTTPAISLQLDPVPQAFSVLIQQFAFPVFPVVFKYLPDRPLKGGK